MLHGRKGGWISALQRQWVCCSCLLVVDFLTDMVIIGLKILQFEGIFNIEELFMLFEVMAM
jgi:hypothetical protein